jgi:ArsR family transcriptional regulator
VDESTPVDVMAARFRALGDPTRLRVVHELSAGTRCVCELPERLDVAGPLLSHHLAVLRDADLVTAARRGRWVDHTLTRDGQAAVPPLEPQLAGADR